ncbi:unnamed protein product [Triticum turgidum subsp. durum]|uniref:E3 ubiquitin protein ligase n=1 Tax=Triticum turgidum subsp. durum TaxID=4567 RepID=A0A9R1S912_TRITD|nr:unnamed protein product [Triticum turgidum subsp. durum]
MDATALHHENQKLVQQLEAQKSEMHALESKFKELRNEQSSYDNTLISLDKMWNQLVDDLILLGVRFGGGLNNLPALDHEELSEESIESCPSEEVFLFMLLKSNNYGKKGDNSWLEFAEEALALRRSATLALMRSLQEAIAAQQARSEYLSSALNAEKSNEGELEETMAELEESRRKLVILQLQRHGGSLMNMSGPNAVNGAVSADKSSDRNMGWGDLKDAVEEAKTLAGDRLFELHETQEDNLILSKQLEDLQGQLKDDNYIFTSKPYTILSDQLHHLNAEIERYKGLVEVLQNDKNQFLQREKEMCAKGESVNNIKQSITDYEAKIEELEHQILKSMAEKNDLEIKVEESLQDSGKKDFKDEIHVMAAALSKEMEMMENQLNRSKDAASEALALREEAESLRTLLAKKISEQKEISDRYNTQVSEIKSLKELIETLEKENQELEFIVDMYGKECSESLTITEIKESENRARKQAEYLRTSLEEHSLELRVKAANEAEAACQRRLCIAEAELEELRTNVDASERDVLELKEAIRIKEAEGDAYISEIETIGQAYEDMQTQNQHLLQQVADRDDFNIKLVSDSVKTKQASASLLSEKHLLQKQLHQSHLNKNSPVVKSR